MGSAGGRFASHFVGPPARKPGSFSGFLPGASVMLRFTTEVLAADLVIKMKGDLDQEQVDAFSIWLNDTLAGAPSIVVIESSDLDVLDTAAITSLVELAGDMLDRGGELRVLNPSLRLRRELQVTDHEGCIAVICRPVP